MHDRYGPGEELCGYLMEHTSTEFPDVNFKRALACLNTRSSISSDTYLLVRRLSNQPIWSDHATMVKARVVVGIEYSPVVEGLPASLKILAARRQH
jgi:hypothetical protein